MGCKVHYGQEEEQIMINFQLLTLKECSLWTLFLHSNQYYIGRAYAWLKREGEMQRLSQMTSEEIQELHVAILPAYEDVLASLWKPKHMNYAWLGNEFTQHQGHGHLHIIPRYDQPIQFVGAEFIDERWGKNYSPYPKQQYSDELVFTIRDALRNALND